VLINLFCQYSYASGSGISSFPKRVVINNNQRTATLTLTNNDNETRSYLIKFINTGFDKNNNFKELKKEDLPAGYKSIKNIIRYSPRRITLKSKESQTVRLLVRRNKKLPEGEYRSHILFQAIPNKNREKDILNLIENDKESIVVKPTILQGLALPVILYQGKTKGSAKIKSFTLEYPKPNKVIAKFELTRQGNRSLYGEIITKQNGKTINILKGLALYTPYKEHTFSIPLDPKKLQSGKKLTVTYRGLDRDAGTTFASGEIIVP